MIFAYIRVSNDKQTTENQRFEILKFADEKRLQIDEWIDETVTGTKRVGLRKLGPLLECMKANDVLIVSEISPGFQPNGEKGACRMRSLPSGSRG
jgi:DNA invertase Pin-like site-specific DNA recombinase